MPGYTIKMTQMLCKVRGARIPDKLKRKLDVVREKRDAGTKTTCLLTNTMIFLPHAMKTENGCAGDSPSQYSS